MKPIGTPARYGRYRRRDRRGPARAAQREIDRIPGGNWLGDRLQHACTSTHATDRWHLTGLNLFLLTGSPSLAAGYSSR